MIIKRVTSPIGGGIITPGSGTGGLTKESGIETDPGFIDGKPGSIWPEL